MQQNFVIITSLKPRLEIYSTKISYLQYNISKLAMIYCGYCTVCLFKKEHTLSPGYPTESESVHT